MSIKEPLGIFAIITCSISFMVIVGMAVYEYLTAQDAQNKENNLKNKRK